jgi:hypothetical protein
MHCLFCDAQVFRKEKREALIQQGMHDFCEWALCVNDVINRISGEDRKYQYGIISRTDILQWYNSLHHKC